MKTATKTTRAQLDSYRTPRGSVRVLLRAYRNKAFSAVAVARYKNAVVVVGADESPGIGYNQRDIFEWDESVFQSIAREPDEAKRAELWKCGKRFDASKLPQLA